MSNFKKLETIQSDHDLLNSLEDFCDFIICTETSCTEDHLFYSKKPYTIFATDGAGGTFGFIGDPNENTASIGYVSSEGQSGKIASSLDEFLSLIIFFPYFWHDLISFYKDHKSNKLLDYILECENEIKADHPDYDTIQTTIAAKLALNRTDQLIDHLIQSLLETPGFIVYSTQDDSPSENLL